LRALKNHPIYASKSKTIAIKSKENTLFKSNLMHAYPNEKNPRNLANLIGIPFSLKA